MYFLSLNFSSSPNYSLYATEFQTPTNTLKCTRGKTCGAYLTYGTFQWTTAVVALSVLILKNAMQGGESSKVPILLEGYSGSLASSLDSAISKETSWLSDMFGSDKSGRLYARNLFLRSNSNLKRAGPVAIAVNTKRLPVSNVFIFLDGELANNSNVLKKMSDDLILEHKKLLQYKNALMLEKNPSSVAR